MTDAIVQTITCPITQQIMVNPVVGSDGNTYDRTAIETWLRWKEISPLTNEHMTIQSLKINPAIKFLIDQYNTEKLTTEPRSPPKISQIDTAVETTVYKNHGDVCLSFKDLCKNFGAFGIDILMCIDRSGSTNDKVQATQGNGLNLESQYSILDIIIHATNTIVSSLNNKDRFACIIFDNSVEVLVPFMAVSELNKNTILQKVSIIKPGGATNMYGAISKAIELLDEREDKTRNAAVMGLTDGVPNVRPARGEVKTLEILKNKINFSVPVYTFGFGYNLEKNLLYPLAKVTNSPTCHIPDGGMVATVFCNAIATIKCTVALNMQIHIKNPDSLKIYGDFTKKFEEEKDELIINIGTLEYQQSRNIVIRTEGNGNFEFYLTYKAGGRLVVSEVMNTSKCTFNETIVNNNKVRLQTVEKLREIVTTMSECDYIYSQEALDTLNDIVKLCTENNEYVENIKHTINDQVTIAVKNPSYFKKWGAFYIDQLSSHLNYEKRPNFKDKACFNFGSEKFEEFVDFSSDTFDELPPPEPSHKKSTYTSSSGSSAYAAAPSAAPVAMSNYNDSNATCFSGKCFVLMKDSSYKKVEDIKQGDSIRIDNVTTTTIKYILKTITKNGKCPLVKFPTGLKITKWHPVYYYGKWAFPGNIIEEKEEECEAVYSFVLEDHHVAIINQIPCICLGHNFTDEVLRHPYFGTNKIVEDLEKMEMEKGVITLGEKWWWIREGGLVVKIVQN